MNLSDLVNHDILKNVISQSVENFFLTSFIGFLFGLLLVILGCAAAVSLFRKREPRSGIARPLMIVALVFASLISLGSSVSSGCRYGFAELCGNFAKEEARAEIVTLAGGGIMRGVWVAHAMLNADAYDPDTVRAFDEAYQTWAASESAEPFDLLETLDLADRKLDTNFEQMRDAVQPLAGKNGGEFIDKVSNSVAKEELLSYLHHTIGEFRKYLLQKEPTGKTGRAATPRILVDYVADKPLAAFVAQQKKLALVSALTTFCLCYLVVFVLIWLSTLPSGENRRSPV